MPRNDNIGKACEIEAPSGIVSTMKEQIGNFSGIREEIVKGLHASLDELEHVLGPVLCSDAKATVGSEAQDKGDPRPCAASDVDDLLVQNGIEHSRMWENLGTVKARIQRLILRQRVLPL